MENQSSKKRIEWLSNVTTPYYTTALKVLRLGMNLRIIEGIWRGNLQGLCTAVPKPIPQESQVHPARSRRRLSSRPLGRTDTWNMLEDTK